MWIQKMSKSRKRHYYYNKETKESVWEKPTTTHYIYHILIKHINSRNKINDRSIEEASKLCKTILSELSNSQDVFTCFVSLANRYSECKSKINGGDLGYLVQNAFYPEFERVAFELDNGQYSNIVQTPSGIHIIYRK